MFDTNKITANMRAFFCFFSAESYKAHYVRKRKDKFIELSINKGNIKEIGAFDNIT